MGIEKFRRKSVFKAISLNGIDLYGGLGMPAISGKVYYVEGNAGLDTQDGLSWDKAKKTLASAITASNANIAAGSSGWAARNTIFCKGDALTEDLTVFPAKCDVVGCGSCDAMNKTRIIGHHIETGDGVIQSTGWYNLEFRQDGTATLFTITTYSGLYFGNCIFTADANCTHAILTSGSCDNITIENCWFRNDEDGNDPFHTAAISLVGPVYNVLIKNNFIQGAIGINIDNAIAYNVWIDNNTIVSTGIIVDDESQLAVITNNALISAAANTANNQMDYNVKLAAGNVCTGDTSTNTCPVEAT